MGAAHTQQERQPALLSGPPPVSASPRTPAEVRMLCRAPRGHDNSEAPVKPLSVWPEHRTNSFRDEDSGLPNPGWAYGNNSK
jgi:hypothetical protein